MSKFTDLAALARQHGQYPVEAYSFVGEGLRHAARTLGKETATGDERHLAAIELVDGVLDLAAERFGLLAREVLRSWGLTRSEDIGAITYHLIECGVFGRQSSDSRSDFDNGPAFAHALEQRVRADLEAVCRR
ncbi:MAG: Minf_1886 family protein [Planctomycetota bacterium]